MRKGYIGEIMTTYINLFGGPGIGKSTTAAELFSMMKRDGKNVELVTEVAKGFVWEGRAGTLQIQPYVLMKQYRDLIRLKGKVDYVITDSPILLGIVYGRVLNPDLPESYFTFIEDCHREIFRPSINILLKRSFEYSSAGRYQTYEEAVKIDGELETILHRSFTDFEHLTSEELLSEDFLISNDIL